MQGGVSNNRTARAVKMVLVRDRGQVHPNRFPTKEAAQMCHKESHHTPTGWQGYCTYLSAEGLKPPETDSVNAGG